MPPRDDLRFARTAGSTTRVINNTEQIKQYDVEYCGGGRNASAYPYRALIGLRRDDGSLMGALYFHRDSTTLPASDERKPDGYVWCHLMWEDFPAIMDLLRNENPVYLRYVAGSWNMASIDTNLEPMGVGDEDTGRG